MFESQFIEIGFEVINFAGFINVYVNDNEKKRVSLARIALFIEYKLTVSGTDI